MDLLFNRCVQSLIALWTGSAPVCGSPKTPFIPPGEGEGGPPVPLSPP